MAEFKLLGIVTFFLQKKLALEQKQWIVHSAKFYHFPKSTNSRENTSFWTFLETFSMKQIFGGKM